MQWIHVDSIWSLAGWIHIPCVPRWSPCCPDGATGVQPDSTCTLDKKLAGLPPKKKCLKSTWTPGIDLDSTWNLWGRVKSSKYDWFLPLSKLEYKFIMQNDEDAKNILGRLTQEQYFTLPRLIYLESMKWGVDCRNSRWIPWDGEWTPHIFKMDSMEWRWTPYFFKMESMKWGMDSTFFLPFL